VGGNPTGRGDAAAPPRLSPNQWGAARGGWRVVAARKSSHLLGPATRLVGGAHPRVTRHGLLVAIGTSVAHPSPPPTACGALHSRVGGARLAGRRGRATGDGWPVWVGPRALTFRRSLDRGGTGRLWSVNVARRQSRRGGAAPPRRNSAGQDSPGRRGCREFAAMCFSPKMVSVIGQQRVMTLSAERLCENHDDDHTINKSATAILSESPHFDDSKMLPNRPQPGR